MSTSADEKISKKERQDIWVELQSLRRDMQLFRTEAYRLRIAGFHDVATNESLRTRQLELERRGEALIKRLSPEVEWTTAQRSVVDDSMNVSQFWLPSSQASLTSGNSLQLQGA